MAESTRAGQESAADARAHEVEAQMTDQERFSPLVSVMGTNPVIPARDARIPEGMPMSAGYVRGVCPALGCRQRGHATRDTDESGADRRMAAQPASYQWTTPGCAASSLVPSAVTHAAADR